MQPLTRRYIDRPFAPIQNSVRPYGNAIRRASRRGGKQDSKIVKYNLKNDSTDGFILSQTQQALPNQKWHNVDYVYFPESNSSTMGFMMTR